MTRLAIFREDEFQDEHVLMRATVALGRHPENDIVLNDLTLSRFHARLERRGDAYVVIDLGAQNGVFLNGQKVTGERGLAPGDRIGIGSYVAIFDQAGAETLRRKSDSQAAVSPVEEPGVSIALDEDSLDDLSIDLDMSNAGVDIEMEDDFPEAEDSVSNEAPFFDAGRTAVVQSEIETGPRSKTELSSVPPVPTLVLLYNGLEVSRHDIAGDVDTIIGRSKSSDVVISLLGLSRRHTRITSENDLIFVEDMGSQNGTWVNNHRIDGKRRVRHGDLLNYYEYGLLFLEDPTVEISASAANVDQTGTEDLDAVETGRQDGISIAALRPGPTPGPGAPIADNGPANGIANGSPSPGDSGANPGANHRVMTNRSPVPIISSEAEASAVGEPALGSPSNERSARRVAPAEEGASEFDLFDGFDLDDISGGQEEYLADALEENEADLGTMEADALDDEDDELKPSHTQILLKKFEEEEEPSYLNDPSRDEISSFRDAPPTGPAHRLPKGRSLPPHMAVDKTSAMMLPAGIGDRGAWPTEGELEPALSADENAPLVQLEVSLDDKLYTQLPMSQPVVRVGTDARCELALPSAAGLAPWQFTLILFGEVVVCYRASRDARVVVDDVIVDQAVLKDGDEIDLGRVRVRIRIR